MPLAYRLYRAIFCFVIGALIPGPSHAAEPVVSAGVTFHSETFRDIPFTVAWVDLDQAKLELFWKDPDGQPFTNFAKLETWLGTQGKTLVVATNSGIYAEDRTPLGLHIAQGEELRKLNPHKGGKSNFALKPNGVFYIDASGAHIRMTEDYAAAPPKPTLAVQSGPLLVINGALHPKFNQDSTSIHFRNGIGIASPRRIAIVIANLPVNFHTFASFFKEQLGCPNALYLDGSLSGFYAPAIERTAAGMAYVGILAVTTDGPKNDGVKGEHRE
ncbi:MAG: phosphodiester glycosidase family protein [Candidatus Hydrogenedentes bacterium]|nr:phosphodiester glycosidase family protein [Candidatus Hydrogenedentota bacterium]